MKNWNIRDTATESNPGSLLRHLQGNLAQPKQRSATLEELNKAIANLNKGKQYSDAKRGAFWSLYKNILSSVENDELFEENRYLVQVLTFQSSLLMQLSGNESNVSFILVSEVNDTILGYLAGNYSKAEVRDALHQALNSPNLPKDILFSV